MTNPDASNMKAVLDSYPEHMESASQLGKIFLTDRPDINEAFICGMGGSGIGGELLKSLTDFRITSIHDYTIPLAKSPKNTLVILCSYSGNTEETLSCHLEAKRQGCRIVGMSSGGKLEELCYRDRNPFVSLPKGLQPRAALAYLLLPLLNILSSYRAIPNQEKNVNSAISSIKQMLAQGKEQVEKTARSLAKQLVGKVPIIYAGPQLSPLAYRWKTQFNENSKVPSFFHTLSELNHNELVGFTRTIGKYHILFLTHDAEHPRISKRISLTKALIAKLSNDQVNSTVISLSGKSILTKILFGIHLGDLASYYLALWYMQDPTPVKIIEELKKELGDYSEELFK